MLLGDAYAGIADQQIGVFLRAVDRHAHRAARLIVLDGVLDQVDEQLLHAVVVAPDIDRLAVFVDAQIDLLLLGVYLEHLAHVVGHLVQPEPPQTDLGVARFQLGYGQYVVDQTREAIGLHHDDVEELLRHFGIVDRAGLQCLDEAAYGGQRRFQLVGDVGGEVGAHLLQLAQLGDVLDHGHRADDLSVALHRGNIEPQRRAGAAGRALAHGDFSGIHAVLRHGLAEERLEIDVLADLADLFALAGLVNAQPRLGDRRHQYDLVIAVDGKQAVLHLIHDHAQRLIAAALARELFVDALGIGVDLLHARRKMAVQLDACVKAPLGEGLEQPFHAPDELIALLHGKIGEQIAQRDQHNGDERKAAEMPLQHLRVGGRLFPCAHNPAALAQHGNERRAYSAVFYCIRTRSVGARQIHISGVLRVVVYHAGVKEQLSVGVHDGQSDAGFLRHSL